MSGFGPRRVTNIMPLYGIAFVVAVVLLAALVFMQVVMRQQVHHARFGNQQISPWDVRFSNNLFGQFGIWKLHKRAYERSAVRFVFATVSIALLVSTVVGIWDFVYLHSGL
jgi:hypothetical protein